MVFWKHEVESDMVLKGVFFVNHTLNHANMIGIDQHWASLINDLMLNH